MKILNTYMIRSTTHSLKFTNCSKLEILKTLLCEWRKCAKEIVSDMWNNGYTWEQQNKENVIIKLEFNPNKELYNVPNFIDYNRFKLNTTLSARALSSLVTQISGILKSSVEKQRKRQFVKDKQLKENGQVNHLLLKKIKQNIPTIPNLDKMNIEVSSKCCDWQDSNLTFNGFLRLKSIGLKSFNIPIKFHKMNKKMNDWKQMSSFLIGDDFINIRWFKEEPALKTTGRIVGADQGAKTCLTLSNGSVTTKDAHGHDLFSIMEEMSRKKKGSKAFKKLQHHRKNYINWSINQIRLEDVKELRLENVWNIGYKNSSSRKLSHWTNSLIRDKVEDVCLKAGVQFIEQSPTYRSQRCNECCMVRSANRKSKIYTCNNCGLEIDADLNSSLNHEQNLPDIPFELRKLKLNKKGFFWKSNGFFNLEGEEIRVPLIPSINDLCI